MTPKKCSQGGEKDKETHRKERSTEEARLLLAVRSKEAAQKCNKTRSEPSDSSF